MVQLKSKISVMLERMHLICTWYFSIEGFLLTFTNSNLSVSLFLQYVVTQSEWSVVSSPRPCVGAKLRTLSPILVAADTTSCGKFSKENATTTKIFFIFLSLYFFFSFLAKFASLSGAAAPRHLSPWTSRQSLIKQQVDKRQQDKKKPKWKKKSKYLIFSFVRSFFSFPVHTHTRAETHTRAHKQSVEPTWCFI